MRSREREARRIVNASCSHQEAAALNRMASRIQAPCLSGSEERLAFCRYVPRAE